MKARAILGCAGALAILAVSAPGVAAPASELAPAAALGAAQRATSGAMTALFARLPPDAKTRLQGAYVAFDESATDVAALAACDDDGDYVVVVSDALLGLAATVAAAQATDESFGTHKLDDYAAFLTTTPAAAGARVLPPPAGFFDAAQARAPAKVALEARRFKEIVGAIVAHELAHLQSGDLQCPNPTATHERGDDVWTREERDHALAVARKLYAPTSVLSADGDATARLLDVGMTEQGELAWLSFTARLERAFGDAGSTYLALHHDEAVRAEVVRAAADQWRRIRAAEGLASAAPAAPPRPAGAPAR